MNLSVLSDRAGGVRLVETAMPPPPTGTQVLVRMIRSPINPADLMSIDGKYAFDLAPDLPLGAEGVGRVEAVGSEVGDLVAGVRVLPLSRGNWCRYQAVERSRLVPLPDDIAPDQAAMLRINPPTAALLLGVSGAGAGDVIVQNAATSSVAMWVRTIAARRNITVIDVTRRADDAMPGAVLDGDQLDRRVKAAAQGRPVRAALDCVAGDATGRVAQCLAPGGRVVVFGHLSGRPVNVRSQLLTGGGLTICGFSLRPAEAAMETEAVRSLFADLLTLYAQDRPLLPVRQVVALSKMDRALALARDGGGGRVLLDLTG